MGRPVAFDMSSACSRVGTQNNSSAPRTGAAVSLAPAANASRHTRTICMRIILHRMPAEGNRSVLYFLRASSAGLLWRHENDEGLGEGEVGAGALARGIAGADDRYQRCAGARGEDGHLRNGSAYLQLGPVGAADDSGADGGGARVCWRDCRGGRERCGFREG